MINAESSLRINLLRFPLIVGVVFLHNYEAAVGFNGGTMTIGLSQNNFVSDFVRYLISKGVSGIAVPTFFMISGYLFCAGFVYSKENYICKLKSRIRTLLVPFLFWNITTLLLITLGQTLSVTQNYFSGKNPLIVSLSGFDYIQVIFGIGRNPISYQFWFIRDLMVLVLLFPIIQYLIRKIPSVFLIILLSYWFLGFWPIYVPSEEATLFFSIGCFLGITGRNLFFLDQYGKVISIAYAVVLIIETVSMPGYSYLHKFGCFLGVFSALFLTKAAVKSETIKTPILALGSASFFVYAAHEPLLSTVRKIAYKIIQPNSDYLILALYFVIPTLVIVILIATYYVLLAYFTKFTHIITGGR